MKRWLVAVTILTLSVAGCGGSGSTGSSTPSASVQELKIGVVQEDRPQAEPWAAAMHDSLVSLQKSDGHIQFTETYDAFTPTKAEPEIRPHFGPRSWLVTV